MSITRSIRDWRATAMAVGLVTLTAACNGGGVETPTAKEPSAEAPAATSEPVSPQEGLVSHDEPFVVDNYPAKLYLGRKNPPKPHPQGDKKKWRRHAGALKAAGVYRFDRDGNLDDIIGVADLIATQTTNVVVTLKDKATGSTRDDTIVLRYEEASDDDNGEDDVLITSKRDLSASSATLSYPAGYDLYVVQVDGYKDDQLTQRSFGPIAVDIKNNTNVKVFVGFMK